MATFKYKARDRSGEILSGSQESASEDTLITNLKEKGLLVLDITKVKDDRLVPYDKEYHILWTTLFNVLDRLTKNEPWFTYSINTREVSIKHENRDSQGFILGDHFYVKNTKKEHGFEKVLLWVGIVEYIKFLNNK